MYKLTKMLLIIPFFCGVVNAASLIDIRHENTAILQSFIHSPSLKNQQTQLQEISRLIDTKKTLHVRVQETYQGFPIVGADAVLHIPNGANVPKSINGILTAAQQSQNATMNGTLYHQLNTDLSNTPAYVFSQNQAEKALKYGIDDYQQKAGGSVSVNETKSHLKVYIDNDHKAHWVYQVSFYAAPPKLGDLPAKPTYLLDAISMQIYQQWDQIQTAMAPDVYGGGFGGNVKTGKRSYDGLANHMPKLNIKRDSMTATCYLENDHVAIKRYSSNNVISYPCQTVDHHHNDVYWNGAFDAINGAYSPSNDMLFAGTAIYNMYDKWYNVVIMQNNKPIRLKMIVHAQMANAYWDGQQVTLGDGNETMYPLTNIDIVSHEFGHAVTDQFSKLMFEGQSGAINEAFSDMAGTVAEFYIHGKNDWRIGADIFKAGDKAISYMDKPSKDCEGRSPGDNCSIDDASQYHAGMSVHYASGVFRRLFYLLATSPNWDSKKAFHVMIDANRYYWTTYADFSEGACGIIDAANALNFDVTSVKKALDNVKVDYNRCT